MKFSELYKQANENITPDNELLLSISKMMREEAKWKKTPFFSSSTKLVSLAASVCILVAVATILPNYLKKPEDVTPEAASRMSNEETAAVGKYIPDEFGALTNVEEAEIYAAIAADTFDGEIPVGDSTSIETGVPSNGKVASTTTSSSETEQNVSATSAKSTTSAWQGYQNFNSYTAWPSADLWDNLNTTNSIITTGIADETIPEEEEYAGGEFDEMVMDDEIDLESAEEMDMDYGDSTMPTLVHYTDLNALLVANIRGENRISYIGYQYNGIFSTVDLTQNDCTPILSMISKHRTYPLSNVLVPDYADGYISISVSDSKNNVVDLIFDYNDFVSVSVAGYSGSYCVVLESGTSTRLLSFLQVLQATE